MILQYVVVALLVGLALTYIVRALTRKPTSGCGAGCACSAKPAANLGTRRELIDLNVNTPSDAAHAQR